MLEETLWEVPRHHTTACEAAASEGACACVRLTGASAHGLSGNNGELSFAQRKDVLLRRTCLLEKRFAFNPTVCVQS
jgi:hypothetical protein